MRREVVEIFEDDNYTIAINTERKDVIINDRDEHAYYKMELEKFHNIFKIEEFNLSVVLKDNNAVCAIIFAFIVATLAYYSLSIEYRMIDSNFVFATIMLLINIPIHESGHILALKLFYKKSKIKLGFKLIFIYPAFYVDTSDSYLLPKCNRIVVYLAGNFMNCIFLLVVIWFFPQYLGICYIVFSNILVNFLPIVKSDGYYAFMCLCNKAGYFQNNKREFIEDCIRGFVMFILLYIFQRIVEMVY